VNTKEDDWVKKAIKVPNSRFVTAAIIAEALHNLSLRK
jgi:hypothetical protein